MEVMTSDIRRYHWNMPSNPIVLMKKLRSGDKKVTQNHQKLGNLAAKAIKIRNNLLIF